MDLNDFHPGRERLAKSRTRSRLTSRHSGHEHRSSFGIPSSHTGEVPPSYNLVENLVTEAVAIAYELASTPKRKLVRIIQQHCLRHLVAGHAVGFHQVVWILQISTARRAAVLNILAPGVSQRFANAIRSQQRQAVVAAALNL